MGDLIAAFFEQKEVVARRSSCSLFLPFFALFSQNSNTRGFPVAAVWTSSVCSLLLSRLLQGCRSRGLPGGSGEVLGARALGTWRCWGPPALGGGR